MRRFFTLTLLAALLLTAGSSPSAQQQQERVASPVRQEKHADKTDRAAADEDFARANQEVSKVCGRLGTDREFSKKFIEAAGAQDNAKIEGLLREAGVRSELKVETGKAAAADRANRITITVCYKKTCMTWESPK